MTRHFVGLEQAMVTPHIHHIGVRITQSVQVAVERVNEYTELVREPAEFKDPRPPADWPTSGSIEVKSLSIRYAVSVSPVISG
jgi:hypothetical protein